MYRDSQDLLIIRKEKSSQFQNRGVLLVRNQIKSTILKCPVTVCSGLEKEDLLVSVNYYLYLFINVQQIFIYICRST